ncbi:accessory gene regulator B family protein [Listeria booriae]|uniref:accessory gene regulator B family protein n=1 Tax=Listeria booriae TaxID=1552123 RepID=UPI001629A5CC|nr:accessory gene regulator B family protein [Listeria booriae]MBC1285765.1 regulator [Listeria booriae]MBC1511362.1 regulator [Listeria booriae]MBC1574753.1 regulator [Listeria booriae]MBC1913447.1 regulator [Listeria booriae]MBC1975453.1 regulator [Listeria booriae]
MFSLTVPNMATKITKTIFRDREVDEDRFAIVKYGVEIFLVNVTKGIIVYLAAALLGMLWQTLVVHLSYLMIRRHSFGLHAKTSLGCTITSVVMFVILPYFVKEVQLSEWMIVLISGLILLNIAIFAPSDTENMPLFNAQKRHVLRRKSILNTIFVLLLMLLIPIGEIKILILYGMFVQVIMIHPWTYKIMKRSYNNYEKY